MLRLGVEDLDLPNRKAKVRRKGGAIDVIVWQTGTARLLPRLLKGRKTGPVFLTDRRARVELPSGDVDQTSDRARLSYGGLVHQRYIRSICIPARSRQLRRNPCEQRQPRRSGHVRRE